MPNRFARDDDPSTRKSAPLMRSAMPMKKRRYVIIFYCTAFIYFSVNFCYKKTSMPSSFSGPHRTNWIAFSLSKIQFVFKGRYKSQSRLKFAPVVQWIECEIADLVIQVRILAGAQNKKSPSGDFLLESEPVSKSV